MLTSVLEGGFRVADSFPVMSEYKVNPHVRNKQSLDMDLVLICQKKSVPFEPLSLPLDDAVQFMMDNLPAEASSGSKNKLFLYLMGELLKAASAAWGTKGVSYDWFAETLTRFDKLINSNIEGVQEKTDDSHFTQLQLF